MSNGKVSRSNIAVKPAPIVDEYLEMDDQDVQLESATIRDDNDIRQSSAASGRVNDKAMEAPEKA